MHHKYSALIKESIRAKKKSYSPYSGFSVGAAVLTFSKKIYTGTNVENASYSLSICAERSAFVKAVTDGERKFIAVAVATSGNDYIYPCGACRQFMAEFGTEMEIIIVKSLNVFRIIKLKELLPYTFDKTFLKTNK